jgi:glycerol-3-phosphate dehydrogenase
MLHFAKREEALDRLSRLSEIPVLILGGGINGAGVFRELAINQVPVLLIDQGDFTQGATAASSRMIHGGLRYLENGEFRLVREALHERDRLLVNAPHAVFPLPTTIPITKRWSGIGNSIAKFFGLRTRPAERGSLIVKLGLTFYDCLTWRSRRLPSHRFMSRTQALQLRPALRPDIIATATYYDAWVACPEKLCLEVIDDAMVFSSSALAINYLKLNGYSSDGTVQFIDPSSGRQFRLRPQVIINACGAWIDRVNQSLGLESHWIGGTKGSHLVIDHPELFAATQGHQLFFENADGRICLFFPIQGRVLVGTTDLRIENPDQAICDEQEIDYLLRSVRLVFPALEVDRSHIISCFCGVRPLPYTPAGATGTISRDHHCQVAVASPTQPWPIYSMIGGKWTTFRAFSEQVCDQVLAFLQRKRTASSEGLKIGASRVKPSPETPSEPRPGGESFEPFLLQLDPASADQRLLEHWTDARLLRAICEREAVVHLEDFWLRRTPLGLYVRLSEECFHDISRQIASLLGWDETRLDQELRSCRQRFAGYGIRLGLPAAKP